ncbi:MAG: hypothetical protein KME64_35220 [Scytonematopsis contorta HA4267-MV1]|jgi:hypothetical protein|nr:hypothetical protein [Scytonematopsis contorta HA4267-MV1]
MYTNLICLANSWKHGDRCIAGIDMATGKWIRPVTNSRDGSIPRNSTLIDKNEVSLLDVLEIPLASTGPDFGFASENRLILPGEWRKIRKITPLMALRYLSAAKEILHNSHKLVLITDLQSLPVYQRYTLQLIRVKEFLVQSELRKTGKIQWKGTLLTVTGQRLENASITDPVFVEKLEAGYRPQGEYLVTVSLSLPYAPPGWDGDEPCWKLIAGVIELTH